MGEESESKLNKQLFLMGKPNAAAGRAVRCLLRIVAWALPTGLMVWFPSREIYGVFFVGEAHATGGAESSEIMELWVSDDLFIFKATFDYILNIIVFNFKS